MESDLAANLQSIFLTPRCLFNIDITASPRSILKSFFEFLGQRQTMLVPEGTWESNSIKPVPFGRTAASDVPEKMLIDPFPI